VIYSTTNDGHYDEAALRMLEIAKSGNFNIKLQTGYPVGMVTFARLECKGGANGAESV
jgi:hypothetical protein